MDHNINIDLAVSREHLDSLAQQSERNNEALEKQVNKLSLICWSMWTLILEATDLTEEDLLQRVKDLDQLDGQADGQATKAVAKCAKCDRVLSEQHPHCLYCGAERTFLSAFDMVT